jgi:hypothetical protein
MLLNWSQVKTLKLPSVSPSSKDWLGEKQIIKLAHNMQISINPPAPSLHGLSIKNVPLFNEDGTFKGYFLCLLDEDGIIGVVIDQKVKVLKSKLRKFNISL